MSITVIVCTYNRCDAVIKALDSIAVQVLPPSVEWDVLIVDNNSTDNTRQVVENYCLQNPSRFSYVFEKKQGLSNARNTGIEKARGNVLAFTDDDAIVGPEWLQNLTSSLLSGECAAAGGRIVPVWPAAVPKWLSHQDLVTLGPFGGFDLGPEPKPLTRSFYGGNMAVRRDVVEKYGGFRADLGRSSTNLMGREDIEIANRLIAAGEKLRYEPNAVIWHPIAESRMKKSYLLRWYYWEAKSEIADVGQLETGFSIYGIPVLMFRRIVRWSVQTLLTTNAQERFRCQRNLWKSAGAISAYYQRLGHPNSSSRASAEMPLK